MTKGHLWWKERKGIFDSFEEYLSYNGNKCKYNTLRDFYKVNNVEIISLKDGINHEGKFYSLELKSREKVIKGLARVDVPQSFFLKWRTRPDDVVRAKVGDNVTIGGYYCELFSALNGEEIPIRKLWLNNPTLNRA